MSSRSWSPRQFHHDPLAPSQVCEGIVGHEYFHEYPFDERFATKFAGLGCTGATYSLLAEKNKIPVCAVLPHFRVIFCDVIDVGLVRETASKNHSGRILKNDFLHLP